MWAPTSSDGYAAPSNATTPSENGAETEMCAVVRNGVTLDATEGHEAEDDYTKKASVSNTYVSVPKY